MGHSSTLLPVVALLLARTIPIVEFVPIFGGRRVSRTVKTAIALGLALMLAPAATHLDAVTPMSDLPLAVLVAKEVLIGMTLGFVTALVFETARMAGALIDGVRGQSATWPGAQDSTATSRMLYALSVPLFFAIGGHQLVLRALARSYVVFPVEALPTLGSAPAEIAAHIGWLTANALGIALLLAMPVISTLLLADLVLLFVQRAAGRVGLAFAVAPLRSVVAIGALLLGLGVFATQFGAHAVALLADLDEAIREVPVVR